jgi:putative Holliday junction resolvase
MRILGLDIGSKRIGIAISDAEGSIAFPSGKIDRQGRERDLEALRALAAERGVERVVVGLPKHMDGREGVEAKAARDFAADLARVTGLPVDTLDERLSTVEAERVLRASGRRAKKQREVVDSVAASIILSTYLDKRRNEAKRRGEDE